LWINVQHPAGDLWINFIFRKNFSAEKPLKTRIFSDMIGKLSEQLSTGYPPFSTSCGERCGYPQLIHMDK